MHGYDFPKSLGPAPPKISSKVVLHFWHNAKTKVLTLTITITTVVARL